MKLKAKIMSVVTSCAVALSAAIAVTTMPVSYAATSDIQNEYDWGTLEIGGAGFVSGIVTGQKEMYLRTDVGGAYRYDYDKEEWIQLFGNLTDADRGMLSVKGIAIDPTDDMTAYFLCGCAYFSDARTEIIKTTDGGKTFERIDVTDLIQVHGNGDGRQCIEPIAIDPDNPDVIYAGGDVTAGESCLIKSTDAGKTWKPVKGYDDLGMYTSEIKWPLWTEHMTRALNDGEYRFQNGIGCILIEDGKVYVGTSITGQANIHVADVDTDEFTELSVDLPTANYPCAITSDKNGNIFFTYISGLAFAGASGDAVKYNVASGKVTDIAPSGNAFGGITADKNDPNKLFVRTCGTWLDQWYEEEWTDTSIAWGDYFYRSTDGGETWTNITPGQKDGDWGQEYFVSNPIDMNGYDWIYGKACHWGSGMVIDPRNPDKILMTSGNGVFACDNPWAEKGVQFYFSPSGVEEVVALDMVSIPGGHPVSVIGDYDGFIHVDPDEIPQQHTPNMGSTGAIAYCPQNPDVMIRVAEHEGIGYYTLDGGATWTKMTPSAGGKAAITQLEDGTYRFFNGSKDDASMSYSDDLGQTWTACSGLPSAYGSKPTYMYVDPEDPSLVYAYVTYFNSSWHYSKPEPDITDACYKLCVSTDYGKTFTSKDVVMYDQCDSAARIAALGDGTIILGAGWNGMYKATDKGQTIEKIDTVSYCKTVGYGAPEEEGGLNTLYIYGKPQDSDPEGIYRSTDGGETWVCINTDNIYGGTGNGNFLVGDMNTFGTVYMSTVGCGIVYGELSDNPEPPTEPTKPTETTEPSETTKPTETTPSETTTTAVDPTEDPTETTETEPSDLTLPTGSIDPGNLLYGDVNLDGSVSVADIAKLSKYIANADIYPVGNGDEESISKAIVQSNVAYDEAIDSIDLNKLIEYCLNNIDPEDLGPQE
ncbi:MAG: 1,4-beta-glucanase [Oscillospiraceae bacterium]|nr:1,4-beta-glucanase [Oscillospiraceae bacterium]